MIGVRRHQRDDVQLAHDGDPPGRIDRTFHLLGLVFVFARRFPVGRFIARIIVALVTFPGVCERRADGLVPRLGVHPDAMTRFEIARAFFRQRARVESATDEIEERGVRERDVTRVSVVARANDARPRGGVLRLRLGYHRGEDGSSVGRGVGEVFGAVQKRLEVVLREELGGEHARVERAEDLAEEASAGDPADVVTGGGVHGGGGEDVSRREVAERLRARRARGGVRVSSKGSRGTRATGAGLRAPVRRWRRMGW